MGKYTRITLTSGLKNSLWIGSDYRSIYLRLFNNGTFLKISFYNISKKFDNELAKILSSFMETRSMESLIDVMNRKNGDRYDLYDVLTIMNDGGFEL